jgi:hypothetical protein
VKSVLGITAGMMLLSMVVPLNGASAENNKKPPPASISVCELLENSKKYDGHIVTVRGIVMAERHSTALNGSECERAVVIRYDLDSQPEGFLTAVEAKRYKRDTRTLEATVMGRFKSRVRARLGYVSRIDVTNVLDYKFVR